MAKMVGVNGALTKLSLAHNRLEKEGTKAICEALKQNKTLKELDLSGRAIGGEAGAKHVADMLGVNGGLTRVDVRRNNIAGDGAAQLAAAVLGNLQIEMFNEIPIKEMRANSLTELDLKGKDVGVEGVLVVAGLIPVMGSLTSLLLAENELGDDGAEALSIGLKENKSLTSLDLRGKGYGGGRIGPRGAMALASAIAVNGSLTKINVSWNSFGSEGAKVFADALRVNGGLTSLDLSSNQLCGLDRYEGGTYTADGITAIADALRVNGALTKIRYVSPQN